MNIKKGRTMKKVLVISKGIVHPTIIARRRFMTVLKGIGGLSIDVRSGIESLRRIDGGGYSGVVLFFHRQKISPRALHELATFVSGGGGLLAVHSASASFKTTPGYFDILGGRFVTHGKVGEFTISPREKRDAIFGTIEDFTVRDELYIHEYRDDITVHFETKTESGMEPVVWTRKHKKGRVCYLSLGHVARVMNVHAVREIIERGLLWTIHG
jgi:type 1 glutamine amidotransferase